MDTHSNELTIESALAELREMFPARRFYVSSVTTGRDYEQPRTVAEIAVYGGRSEGKTFAASSLNEAMNPVRQWHAEQGKESKG